MDTVSDNAIHFGAFTAVGRTVGERHKVAAAEWSRRLGPQVSVQVRVLWCVHVVDGRF